MRRRAEEALIKMGMPANIKGFRYITDIMEKYAEDDAWIYGKLTFLYEMIYLTFDNPTNGNLLVVFYLRLKEG